MIYYSTWKQKQLLTNRRGLQVRTKVVLLTIALACTILIGGMVFGADVIDDDFENYPVGDLNGATTTQGYWQGINSVVDTIAFHGDKSSYVFYYNGAETRFWLYEMPTSDNFTQSFYFVPEVNGKPYHFYFYCNAVDMLHFQFSPTQAFLANAVSVEGTWNAGNWYKISLDISGNHYTAKVNDNAISESVPTTFNQKPTDCINWFGFVTYLTVSGSNGYLDLLGTAPPPPPFKVWGISPEPLTEITATTTDFTFGYEGFQDLQYHGFQVNFSENTTGIFSENLDYTYDEVGLAGEITIPFGDFNFDANGLWCLVGSEYFYSFNTQYEWVKTYLGDAVDPIYCVWINFEGLPTIFAVEEPTTWYGEHTEYATATAFFTSITDILTPIFSKIGEFGSRITGFFDANEAYVRGKDIGSSLIKYTNYIAQIDFFFGGFPIIETFILAMMIIVGFFLFKLIFKLVRG